MQGSFADEARCDGKEICSRDCTNGTDTEDKFLSEEHTICGGAWLKAVVATWSASMHGGACTIRGLREDEAARVEQALCSISIGGCCIRCADGRAATTVACTGATCATGATGATCVTCASGITGVAIVALTRGATTLRTMFLAGAIHDTCAGCKLLTEAASEDPETGATLSSERPRAAILAQWRSTFDFRLRL